MLSKLISECTDYELKIAVEINKPKSWLKSVSALANTIGGNIIFGISNNYQIVGVENIQKLCEIISELIKVRIKPTPAVRLIPFKEKNKLLIALKVFPGNATPYYYAFDGIKEAYIRLGNESIVAPSHILNELILKGNNQTYDTLVTNHQKRDYSFEFFEATFLEITHTKLTESDYRSFNLINSEGFLTNAGVLLADQNIYKHNRIFCTHWNGFTKTSIDDEAIDDKEISGSIVKQLYTAIDFIKNNSKNKWFKSGINRIEKPDYDLDAIREAIVNALIHREYTRLGAEINVDIYSDRLEIISPGNMLSGKKINKNYNSIIASERRNPVLADVFARMKFMERRGSGLKKITKKTNDLFDDEKNHVEFYSDNSFFKVIIYNSNFHKEFDPLEVGNEPLNGSNEPLVEPLEVGNEPLNGSNEPLDEPFPLNILQGLEKTIVQIIIKKPNSTMKDISLLTKKSYSTIKRTINILKEKNIIRKEKNKKNGGWILININFSNMNNS